MCDAGSLQEKHEQLGGGFSLNLHVSAFAGLCIMCMCGLGSLEHQLILSQGAMSCICRIPWCETLA